VIGAVATDVRKAGLSGLLLSVAMLIGMLPVAMLIGMLPAPAQPVAIEIVSAELAYDQRTRKPIIAFRMSEASRRIFQEFTQNNVGKKMAVKFDGRLLMAPVIREPILGGSGQISSDEHTEADMKVMAERMTSGKAIVEFEIVP
jgi:preprotein translocase subunit SecD